MTGEALHHVKWSVVANRTEDGEFVSVDIENRSYVYASAHFSLTREQAYNLAHALQRQADWLAKLEPQPRAA